MSIEMYARAYFLYGSVLFTYSWILLRPSSLHFRIARQGHYSLSPSAHFFGGHLRVQEQIIILTCRSKLEVLVL